MPELPEVETIARNLREGTAGCFALPGRTISGFELNWSKTLAEPSSAVLTQILPGQVIRDVSRRGKYVVISLTRSTILIHLRMSGDLLTVEDGDEPNQKHIRFALEFLEGGKLLFNDPRKFGRIWVVDDPEIILGGLGPEPLDSAMTTELFFEALQKRNRILKTLLLDQSFIVGLGNIYTDEALHLARLHPRMLSGRVTAEESRRLLEAIRSVLSEGIRRNGSSIDWVYRGGDYQNNFRVYGQTGKPCPICGTEIIRMVVGQRGTHVCPKCQPEPLN